MRIIHVFSYLSYRLFKTVNKILEPSEFGVLLCSPPGQQVSHQTKDPVIHTRGFQTSRQLQECGPASACRGGGAPATLHSPVLEAG